MRSCYHFLVLIINPLYCFIILYQVCLLLKRRCFLFHFAVIWAFNSTLSAGFDRHALICNQMEAVTLFKCTQNVKDTGERRRREEGKRKTKGKTVCAKLLFLMWHSTPCTKQHRGAQGEKLACEHSASSQKTALLYLSLLPKQEVGRRKMTRSARRGTRAQLRAERRWRDKRWSKGGM